MTKSFNKALANVIGLVVLFGSPQFIHSQAGTAMLSGLVTDANGAAIPNAEVVLRSTQETASRPTVTNSSGAYVIPAVLPGSYQLYVKASGFQAQTIMGISLVAGQGSTLNVQLRVAATETSVEVHETPPLLDTTTATVGAQLQTKELVALPALGRNFTTLIPVLPSVVNISNDTGSSGVAGIGGLPVTYGLRPRYNNLTVDGIESVEPLFTFVGLYPPPEAIAEMKVDEATDQGTSGWVPGANVSLVTKSGTNTYHGDVWEFLRNNDLNAHDYFAQNAGDLKWNQFGFAGGGPLQLPHLLSKKKAWYIFGYYEGIRFRTPTNWLNYVPTTDEMKGDFSADTLIYNPYTSTVDGQGALVSRQVFPGNKIPMGSTNLCAPQPTCVNPQALALAQAFYPAPNLAPGAIAGVNYIQKNPNVEVADQESARVDHQFRSDTFYARFSDWRDNSTSPSGIPAITYTSNRNVINSVVSDTHVFNPTTLLTVRFGVLRNNNVQQDHGPSTATTIGGTLSSFPAFEGTYDLIPSVNIAGYNGMDQYLGFYGPEYNWEWSVDTQKIKGNHTFTFGGAVMRTTFITDNQSGTDVNFTTLPTSLGANSGNAFASFLLGLPDSTDRVVGSTEADMSGNEYSLYAQDTFHATSKLSMNLGLRWEVALPLINKFGSATFDFETGQYLWDMKNPITGAPANVRRGIVAPDWNSFSPRLGIAYQLTTKTVVRASGGTFFETAGDNYQWEQGNRGNWPFAFPQSVAGLNTTVPSAMFPNPFPGPAQGSTTPLGCEQCLEASTARNRMPYIEEWTLSIQHSITSSLVAEGDYVGNHGVKLGTQTFDNVATTPGTDPYQNRQPYPNFPAYINNMYDGVSAWYEGMSLNLNWRSSHNLSFLVNYTWQKALDQVDQGNNGGFFNENTITPTRYNLAQFKGPAMYSMANVFHASYVYQLPTRSQNSLLNSIIANWETSGIVTLDSGPPVYSMLTTDNENIGYNSWRSVEFPNLVCDPSKGFQWSLSHAVNTSCYQLPPYGTAGNAGKHVVYGNGLKNWDGAIIKRWPFAESRSLEFRAEFFNWLNGHTFDPPDLNFGTPQFGTIHSTSQQHGRQIQLALKVHF